MAIKSKKLRARRRQQQFANLRRSSLRQSWSRRRLWLKKRWLTLTRRLNRWLHKESDIKSQQDLFD